MLRPRHREFLQFVSYEDLLEDDKEVSLLKSLVSIVIMMNRMLYPESANFAMAEGCRRLLLVSSITDLVVPSVLKRTFAVMSWHLSQDFGEWTSTMFGLFGHDWHNQIGAPSDLRFSRSLRWNRR